MVLWYMKVIYLWLVVMFQLMLSNASNGRPLNTDRLKIILKTQQIANWNTIASLLHQATYIPLYLLVHTILIIKMSQLE